MKRNRSRCIGLDTSIVLRLLLGEPETQAKKAVAQLDEIRTNGQQAVVCDLVVSEAYFALQHHYDVPKQIALDHLREFFESPEILATGEAPSILSQPNLGKAKPGFVDRLIHAHYLRETGGMLTFEKAAAKLPGAILPK
ncbi:MAG: PIN domain-containing protein [Opitutales bacterium]|nr:PIN domain-containing protein [Opitutales bacterium]